MRKFAIKLEELTKIWTGDADKKSSKLLRETGIIGSLRWWYEAMIRGLRGTACDPTDTNCKDNNHCDACELFGCTGWARKFRLEVEKENRNVTLQFMELREMSNLELALLNITIKIIAEYGSLGGKIAKSEGLIKIEKNGLERYTANKIQIDKYLKRKGSNTDNPNIMKFIFINKNLKYYVIKELKNSLSFLKGQPGNAKRYFYKTFQNKPYRFFAYAKDEKEYAQIKEFLEKRKVQFVEGGKLLEELK
ncbi:MAG: type III-B CRISPR module RAMP protein Cmr1 [Candidatus Jordarchaeum sp.]|uniref:type III-B CRISPR module RAMP protein Cmr1 n=1 Tax=Candidatus Jordarchaeum sp. TaxID=2823881 RepID=UPI00404B1F9D